MYTVGVTGGDGGWFTNIRVQVYKNNTWVDVDTTIDKTYPENASCANQTYTFTLTTPVENAQGVRVIGEVNGSNKWVSIKELAAN